MDEKRRRDRMPGHGDIQNGRLVANGHVSSPTDRTPLIPGDLRSLEPEPEDDVDQPNGHANGIINGKPNGRLNGHAKSTETKDDGHTTANQTMTTTRTILCTLALGCLIFLQATNISLLTTTQSRIAEDLEVYDQTSWFTSSYLIAMSALSPLNGKLASVFSPRICIFVSSGILAMGAVVTSFARTFTLFIAGRVITGVGASGVFTVSIIIVIELTGSQRRGLAIGLLNSGYTVGVALGATLAGALLEMIGWRALFWAQAPIAVLGGTVLLFSIPHDFTAGKKDSTGTSAITLLRGLDYLGALTLTTTIVLLLYALSSPHNIPLLPLVLSVIALIIFLVDEIYLSFDPIIPLPLLRSRGLLLTCLGTVGYMLSRWSLLFYTPTYALAVRGWSPATAGSVLIPTNAGFALGGLAVGYLHITRRGSFWGPTVVVYALFPITLAALVGLATRDSSPTLFILVLGANGAVTGAALNYTLAHVLHLTPKKGHYTATSLLATFRGFAGSFGSAIGGGIFTRKLRGSLEQGFAERGLLDSGREKLVRRLLGSPALVRQLEGVEKEVAVTGYEEAVRTLFLAAAVLAVVMVLVQAGTGWKGAVEEDDETGEIEAEREELVRRSHGDEEEEG